MNKARRRPWGKRLRTSIKSAEQIFERRKFMTDKIIDFFESDRFKNACLLFLAFAAGYFAAVIMVTLWLS